MINQQTYKHLWEKVSINSYSELLELASQEIARHQLDTIVCGPLFTGGKGSFEANATFLDALIREKSPEYRIFDQLPYLDIYVFSDGEHDLSEKFEQFYLPIIGKMKKVIFAPGWEKSQGSQTEHKYAQRLRKEIIYLKG